MHSLGKDWDVADVGQSGAAKIAIKWFDIQLSKTLLEVDDLFKNTTVRGFDGGE